MADATQVAALLAERAGVRLDIGCGRAKQDGFVGMDVREVEGVDIVHDLETFPWPIDPDTCLVVLASHILEHIKPWKFMDPAGRPCVMGEIWRVLKPDGQLLISCPYGVSAGFVQDPTHCFGPGTEVLTERGFLPFEKVTTDDRALVLDPEQLRTSWSPITGVIDERYCGHLLHFATKRMDLLVTPRVVPLEFLMPVRTSTLKPQWLAVVVRRTQEIVVRRHQEVHPLRREVE